MTDLKFRLSGAREKNWNNALMIVEEKLGFEPPLAIVFDYLLACAEDVRTTKDEAERSRQERENEVFSWERIIRRRGDQRQSIVDFLAHELAGESVERHSAEHLKKTLEQLLLPEEKRSIKNYAKVAVRILRFDPWNDGVV